MSKMCYLDNAATSFPKPKSVIREVGACLRDYCGNAGRGSHKLSLSAANKIYSCRESICSLLNLNKPENIVFAPSCTYGLNLIIKGVLRHGDHVLISDMEHNSVWRPIKRLSYEGRITFDAFSALSFPERTEDELLREIQSKIRKNTRLVICNHQSNVCSYSLPISKIGELCKKMNVLFALDVAQSIGHYNIDMQNFHIDFLSAPGHKGLYGVQGSAFVAINSDTPLDTLIEGGNGIYSLTPDMPDFAPERYEVGTLPLPAIAGLHEGIKEVQNRGINAISEHERTLFRRLRDGLLNIRGANVYLPELEGSTLLFNINGFSAERIGAYLDEQNICVRAGFHCSALAHTALGTQNTAAVRTSFGIFNTEKDIDRLLSVLRKVEKKLV